VLPLHHRAVTAFPTTEAVGVSCKSQVRQRDKLSIV
jgi:hypothetical protein